MEHGRFVGGALFVVQVGKNVRSPLRGKLFKNFRCCHVRGSMATIGGRGQGKSGGDVGE